MTSKFYSINGLTGLALSALIGSVLIGTAGTGLYCYRRRVEKLQKEQEEALRELERRRQEERRGRIRAEVKLRTFMKEKQQKNVAGVAATTSTSDSSSSAHHSRPQEQQLAGTINRSDQNSANSANSNRENNGSLNHSSLMVMEKIGSIVSPYTKRMGTPRQGALVPASRGYIDFSSSNLQMEALDGIEEYSHLWILFGFHANTNPFDSKKVKVRPPRYAGSKKKVGQLSTRSPHRPNPIGLSLVKMERLEKKEKKLYISALDLVNGTPVYDVKPYIPWDVPGYYHYFNTNVATSFSEDLRVPDWVQNDNDVIQNITFTQKALTNLRQMLEQNRLAPLYTLNDDGFTAAKETLEQILAQDPRSSHKGIKNGRRTLASKSMGTDSSLDSNAKEYDDCDIYKLVFCQTEIHFVVLLLDGNDQAEKEAFGVRVVGIQPMEFDQNFFAEGIPLVFSSSSKSQGQTSD